LLAVEGRRVVLPAIRHPYRFDAAAPRASGVALIVAALAVGAALVAAWMAGGGGAHRLGTRLQATSIPLAARGPVSAAIGHRQAGYGIRNLHGHNRAQRLAATFSSTGASIASGSARFGLALTGYGRGSMLRSIGPARPTASANRVDYVLVKPVTGWTDTNLELTSLTSTDAGAGDLFGAAVGIDGNTIAVGALRHAVGGIRQGAAYVYLRSTLRGIKTERVGGCSPESAAAAPGHLILGP
jgi:FG-GAP repeat